MTDTITAIFANEMHANATLAILANLGIEKHLTLLPESVERIDPLLIHRLNQGSSIIQFTITEEQWIASYEVICSLGGEVHFPSTNYEVINKMYHIPEETFEHDEANAQSNATEVGEISYSSDQLDDDAYIDPNFGLGNQDLLIPFLEEPNEDTKA